MGGAIIVEMINLSSPDPLDATESKREFPALPDLAPGQRPGHRPATDGRGHFGPPGPLGHPPQPAATQLAHHAQGDRLTFFACFFFFYAL